MTHLLDAESKMTKMLRSRIGEVGVCVYGLGRSIERGFCELRHFLSLLTGSNPSIVGAYTTTPKSRILEFGREVH